MHNPGNKRLLAVSSGGGHWIQLQRLSEAFEDCDVSWVTVREGYRVDLKDQTDAFYVIPDATRWNKFGLMILFFKLMLVIIKVRPHAIVSTGAASEVVPPPRAANGAAARDSAGRGGAAAAGGPDGRPLTSSKAILLD